MIIIRIRDMFKYYLPVGTQHSVLSLLFIFILKSMDCLSKKKSFTLIEIMLVVTLVALLSALAIPGVLRTNISTNENLAIASLKAISFAVVTYSASNESLTGLTLSALANALPPHLNKVLCCDSPPCRKAGYNFPEIAIGGANNNEYLATAEPIVPNITGIRSFCVTEDGTVRIQAGGGAIADYDTCLMLPPVS